LDFGNTIYQFSLIAGRLLGLYYPLYSAPKSSLF